MLIYKKYKCDVHGEFEIPVNQGDAQDAVRCPSFDWSMMGDRIKELMNGKMCGELAVESK